MYVFTRPTWAQQIYIKAPAPTVNGFFGESLSFTDDGATLAIGEYQEQSDATGVNGDELDMSAAYSGAVFVLQLVSGTWGYVDYLKASTVGARAFGWSSTISPDGSALVVGAPYDSAGSTGLGTDPSNMTAVPDCGSLYSFGSIGASEPALAYDKNPSIAMDDNLGWATAMSTDGSVIAAGAPGAGSSGAATVITNGSSEVLFWGDNTEAGDELGYSIGLSGDGATLVAGAPHEASAATGVDGDGSDNSAPAAGAAYVFD